MGFKLSENTVREENISTAGTLKPSNWKWPLDNSSGHYRRCYILVSLEKTVLCRSLS